MYYVFDKSVADQIRGNYGECNSIEPTLLSDGRYCLHESVLKYMVFEAIFSILKQCELVEILFEEQVD